MKNLITLAVVISLISTSCKKETTFSSNCKPITKKEDRYFHEYNGDHLNETYWIYTDNGSFQVNQSTFASKQVGDIFCNN